MPAGLLLGISHDRHLLREAQVNIGVGWFIGYGLEDELPDDSSLTRIRQRWGEARFKEIFRRADCLPRAWSSKVVLVPRAYPALLRARCDGVWTI